MTGREKLNAMSNEELTEILDPVYCPKDLKISEKSSDTCIEGPKKIICRKCILNAMESEVPDENKM